MVAQQQHPASTLPAGPPGEICLRGGWSKAGPASPYQHCTALQGGGSQCPLPPPSAPCRPPPPLPQGDWRRGGATGAAGLVQRRPVPRHCPRAALHALCGAEAGCPDKRLMWVVAVQGAVWLGWVERHADITSTYTKSACCQVSCCACQHNSRCNLIVEAAPLPRPPCSGCHRWQRAAQGWGGGLLLPAAGHQHGTRVEAGVAELCLRSAAAGAEARAGGDLCV
jgi:hypothetical protein